MAPVRPVYTRAMSSNSLYRRSSRPLRRPWHVVALILVCCLVWSIRSRFSNGKHSSVGGQIRRLHEQAKSKHADSVSRQSTTLEAATSEYKRRYSMDPPPGFNAWFEYATKMSSPIIDDYDDLVMNQLKPYRGFQEAKCDLTANRVTSDDLVRLCVLGDSVDVEGNDRDAVQPLATLMKSIADHLPSMCIVVNTLDLPRTVLNHAKLSHLYGPLPPTTCEIQRFEDRQRLSVWNDVTMSCSHDSNARTGRKELAASNANSLVHDWYEATDLCPVSEAPPSGVILAPEHMRLSNVVRPLLSSAVFSTFHDIQYPSARHYQAASQDRTDEMPWHVKRELMSWRGDSSGGFASGNNWYQFQRQRMVEVASGKDRNLNIFSRRHLDESSSHTATRRPPSVSRWLDVGFTNITSCEGIACEMMEKDLGTRSDMTLQQLSASKLVLSMDGYGADPKFYDLLRSSSAVVRQGLLREWHDSRLVPWLHYIPLSLGMQELPEMLEYLFKDGDYIAQKIAEEGQDWANKALRKEDMNVYLFRLLIEMGRRTF